MTLQIAFFNIWAVLLSILIHMALGMLWYSPLMFGNIWLKLTGRRAEDISNEEARSAMGFAFIPAVVSSLSLAMVLGFAGVESLLDGLIIASLAALGFSAMSMLNLVFFENRSLKLTLLNAGYSFVGLNLAAILLTLWR